MLDCSLCDYKFVKLPGNFAINMEYFKNLYIVALTIAQLISMLTAS